MNPSTPATSRTLENSNAFADSTTDENFHAKVHADRAKEKLLKGKAFAGFESTALDCSLEVPVNKNHARSEFLWQPGEPLVLRHEVNQSDLDTFVVSIRIVEKTKLESFEVATSGAKLSWKASLAVASMASDAKVVARIAEKEGPLRKLRRFDCL